MRHQVHRPEPSRRLTAFPSRGAMKVTGRPAFLHLSFSSLEYHGYPAPHRCLSLVPTWAASARHGDPGSSSSRKWPQLTRSAASPYLAVALSRRREAWCAIGHALDSHAMLAVVLVGAPSLYASRRRIAGRKDRVPTYLLGPMRTHARGLGG
jgi:hypothetical protein